jgi:hypothetical protein
MQAAAEVNSERKGERKVDGRSTRAPLPHAFQKGAPSANPLGRASPKIRAKERAERLAVDRQAVTDGLLADVTAMLGREPGMAQRLLIESAAQQAIEGREARRSGRSSAEPDRLLARMLGMLGLLEVIGPGAPPPDLDGRAKHRDRQLDVDDVDTE